MSDTLQLADLHEKLTSLDGVYVARVSVFSLARSGGLSIYASVLVGDRTIDDSVAIGKLDLIQDAHDLIVRMQCERLYRNIKHRLESLNSKGASDAVEAKEKD